MKKRNSLKKGASMRSDEDVFGSYTGTCIEDKNDKPVQDADDL